MSQDPFNFGPPTGQQPQGPPPGWDNPQAPAPSGGFGDRTGSGARPDQHRPGASQAPQGAGGHDPFAGSGGPGGNPLLQSGTPEGHAGNPLSDSAASSAGELTFTKPPLPLLIAAMVIAVPAGVVALLAGSMAVMPTQVVIAIVCWVLAGPAAIGIIALFISRDNHARSSGNYVSPPAAKPLYFATVAVCLLAILPAALRIADWVGRL